MKKHYIEVAINAPWNTPKIISLIESSAKEELLKLQKELSIKEYRTFERNINEQGIWSEPQNFSD